MCNLPQICKHFLTFRSPPPELTSGQSLHCCCLIAHTTYGFMKLHINKSLRITPCPVRRRCRHLSAAHSGPTLLGPHFITAGPTNLACAVNLSQVCKTFSLHSVPPPAVTAAHQPVGAPMFGFLVLLSLSSAVSLVHWRAGALIENAL